MKSNFLVKILTALYVVVFLLSCNSIDDIKIKCCHPDKEIFLGQNIKFISELYNDDLLSSHEYGEEYLKEHYTFEDILINKQYFEARIFIIEKDSKLVFFTTEFFDLRACLNFENVGR